MESFSMGRTMSRAIRLVISTLPTVGLLILLIQVVNAVVQYFAQDLMMAAMGGPRSVGDPAAALGIFTSGWYWVATVLALVISAFTFAGSVHGMIVSGEGGRPSLGDCVSVGFAKLLPVLALSILWYLGLILGFILLVVPGIILAAMWSVALPAMMHENTGVFASFGRSRQLTKGSRMMIFLTYLVITAIVYVAFFALLGAVLGGGVMGMTAWANQGPVMRIVTIPIGWISSAFTAALMASTYLEVVLVKEGGTTGHLDEVFA